MKISALRMFLVITPWLFSADVFAQLAPHPEADHGVIGYSTVAEALAALRKNPDVSIRVQDGWTIANDSKDKTIWSFAPEGHPAYPAAIKRHMYEKGGALYVGMTALCQAGKAVCDDLIREFEQMNARLGESMRKRAQEPDSPANAASSQDKH